MIQYSSYFFNHIFSPMELPQLSSCSISYIPAIKNALSYSTTVSIQEKKCNDNEISPDLTNTMEKFYEAAENFLDEEGLYIVTPSASKTIKTTALKMCPSIQTIKSLSEKSLLSTEDEESREDQDMSRLAIPSFLLKRTISSAVGRKITTLDINKINLSFSSDREVKSASVTCVPKERPRFLSLKPFIEEDITKEHGFVPLLSQ